MPLPEPRLDDLQFQKDLVDEARLRIIRYCPEWTDYNLSDPGITLIELFAWMTEQLAYRLNRVPEKNHLQFMNLLGVQLRPPSSARVALTFRLSTFLPLNPGDDTVAVIPAGTEVATRRNEEEPEVIFSTDARLLVTPPHLTEARREEDFNKNYLPRFGVEVFHAFRRARPQVGDTFYLGFDPARDLSGHILRLEFQCEETEATGVKRNDPPLVWEVSGGEGVWHEVKPSALPNERDTTGGLNNAQGAITFYLPLALRADVVNGRTAYWVRCRLQPQRKEQGMYSQSPRILSITASTSGATTRATHAVAEHDEMLGTSSGEPGQIFRLRHAPVLALQEDENIEVEEVRDGALTFIPWTRVNDFSLSTHYDRHFMLDLATGEIAFGPCIRQANGNMKQYGRVPATGHYLRMTRYRYGGGAQGNVPPGRLQVLHTALPYVDSVTNFDYAKDGLDPETLDEAKMRARREIRAQQRAVTAEDFENLAKHADPDRGIARAKCLTPGSTSSRLAPGMLEVMLIPAAFDSIQTGDLSKLALAPKLLKITQTYLDRHRLLTTSVRLREPNYIGIQVAADIVVSDYSHPDTVKANVVQQLKNFLSPLAIGDNDYLSEMLGETWEGWPFGRALYQSELFSLIQRVPGVKHVLEVRMSQRPIVPAQEGRALGEDPAQGEPAPLTPINQRRLEVAQDTVLCALEPEIKTVTV